MRCGIGLGLGLLLLVAGGPLAADEEAPRRPWLLLLKTQLLETPGGYPAFCKAQATAKRGALRTSVVAKLKAIADAEQPTLLEALGNPKDAQRLWLVNGIVVRLDAKALEAAKAHALVLHAYPAGMLPAPPKKPGRVDPVHRRRKKPRTWKLGKKTVPWNLEQLNVPRVWKELEIIGRGVTVAMFDTGINYEHEDLAKNIWINPDEKPNNGRDDDKNGLVDDYYGYCFVQMTPEVMDRSPPKHGSLTSSVVAGDGTGGTQTGVAPGAQLMALRGAGGPYNACRAFQYALEEGADVVNMSFSIPNLGHTRGLWRRMAEHASAAGLVLISGAGNFGRQTQVPVQIRIPEGIPCVICAGGVRKDLSVPVFTSKGPVEWSGVAFYEDHPLPGGLIKPDVSAFPGPGIALIRGGRKDGYLPEDNKRRGNSLSAPHVAGVVALMLEADPELTPWAVKSILEATAKDLDAEGKDPNTGAGLVDAFAAVSRAKQGPQATTGAK
ncbi:MAG: S8 family serine peptidase [Planctomycetota bacterium]|nr:S8 family serine peptidase [Planctomycetota bacterium]